MKTAAKLTLVGAAIVCVCSIALIRQAYPKSSYRLVNMEADAAHRIIEKHMTLDGCNQRRAGYEIVGMPGAKSVTCEPESAD